MTILHQRDTVAGLVARIARLRGEAAALESLGAAERDATPPGGGWSVGQVVEHLAISNEDYLPLLRQLVERGRVLPPASANTTWKPRLLAGLLWRSLAKEGNRFPAPKQIRPAASAPADALPRYRATLEEVDALLPATGDLPWNRLVGRSPISRWVRPNLGDALMTVVVHGERHHRQIARVRAATGVAKGN